MPRTSGAGQTRVAQTGRYSGIRVVEGDAVGGGCGLALASDLRIATPAARFGITAARLGLVCWLHDVKRLVERLAGGPSCMKDAIVAASRHSARAIKGFLRRVADGQSEDDAETPAIFAPAFAGADFAAGAAAFVERRQPQFRA